MSVTDTLQRTMSYASRALECIQAHGTSADPEAYEVWYEHVSGRRRPLSADLKSRTARGRVTEDDVRELRETYLSSSRLAQTTLDTGAIVSREMSGMLERVRGTLHDINGCDGELWAVTDRLRAPGLCADDVEAAILMALDFTRRIADASVALENNLKSSQARIGDLTSALVTARGAALTDGLTGLANRRAFDERLAEQCDDAVASRLPLSLVLIDIDHFKIFNDTHGHASGDQVIRLVATAIRQRLGENDFAARFGGQEFVVFGLGRSLNAAVALAEEIRNSIGGYEIVQGQGKSIGKVTISAGAATLDLGETGDELLMRADAYLRAAKRKGRDRVETAG